MTTPSNDPIANLSRLYLEPLLVGDRNACRKLIDAALAGKMDPYTLLTKLIWPTMEKLQALYREDRVSIASLNMATRLNRSITDQLCAKLEQQPANGKKVLIFCGNDEPEELGGQICADLFECDGYTVRFAGGGVPEDEVLKLIGDRAIEAGGHVEGGDADAVLAIQRLQHLHRRPNQLGEKRVGVHLAGGGGINQLAAGSSVADEEGFHVKA